MSRVHAEIATSHTGPTPGWSAPDVSPAEWIEQTVRPLLEGTGATVSVPWQHRGTDQKPTAARVACSVDVANSTGYDRAYERLTCTLFWVGEAHHVAISPKQVQAGYDYGHAPNDLRYLAGGEALVALVRALRELAQRAAFQQQKREKIKAIKRQAILAQLRQIAAEERFAFYLETTTLTIRVGVRLDDKNQLLLSIPFSQFETILPRVREAVVSLRALHQHKIRFRTAQIGRRTQWITPDPPEPST